MHRKNVSFRQLKKIGNLGRQFIHTACCRWFIVCQGRVVRDKLDDGKTSKLNINWQIYFTFTNVQLPDVPLKGLRQLARRLCLPPSGVTVVLSTFYWQFSGPTKSDQSLEAVDSPQTTQSWSSPQGPIKERKQRNAERQTQYKLMSRVDWTALTSLTPAQTPAHPALPAKKQQH